MNPENKTFLRNLKKVNNFAVDATQKDLQEEDFQKPFFLSRAQFYEKLYVEREVENKIKYALTSTSDIIFLVGPKGSGKTSLGLKVQNDLLNQKSKKSFFAYMDMRLERSSKDFNSVSKEEFEKYLRNRIIDRYYDNLFRFDKNHDNTINEVKLWAFILEYLSEEYKPRYLFDLFHTLQSKAARIKLIYDNQAKKTLSYYEWLAENHTRDNQISIMVDELKSKIDLPHLVYAAYYIHQYTRQYIWIDNIDTLPEEIQSEIALSAKRFHGQIAELVATLIAIREENVFRSNDFADQGAPPFSTRIILEIPKDDQLQAYYPSLDIPLASRNTLNRIIRKRLIVTSEFQNEEVKSIQAKLDINNQKKMNETNHDIKSNLLQIEDELTNELKEFQPLMSDSNFKMLNKISDRLLGTMHLEKAIFLSNNSIRDFIRIYRDCLSFMLKSPNSNNSPYESLQYPTWYLSTLFFSWIRFTNRKYQIGVYDIVKLSQEWHESKKVKLGCFIEHLLITTIWNLSINHNVGHKSRPRNPRVDEVIDTLKLLNYDEDMIKKNMHSLYYHNSSRGNIIEFRSRKVLNHWKEIENSMLIYLTYRAKTLVSYSLTSFGYIYACILDYENIDKSDLLSHHPTLHSTENMLNKMLPYLCDIAQMHIEALTQIRDSEKLGLEDWLSNYYSSFGIPLLPPYARKTQVGRVLHNQMYSLQFELLIDSLLRYVRKVSAKKDLEILQNEFSKQLIKLEKFEESKVSFRDILNLPSRMEK